MYVSDPRGQNVRSITEGRPGVPQRNNGNARFHPSGRYIVFVSEEEKHFGTGIKGSAIRHRSVLQLQSDHSRSVDVLDAH